jgi:acyl-coenzyme A synthetase/AMP-(fatty) acid ligase
MNFARDVVDRQPASRPALVELGATGERRVWSFGEISSASARVAGQLRRCGAQKGDIVMTLIGNRAEWILTMLACFRTGLVVLPCTEQLRAHDLALRLRLIAPRVVVTHERDAEQLNGALALCDGAIDPPAVLVVPRDDLTNGPPVPAAELSPDDDCLITFTSGTSGEPKAVIHGQRYLLGQRLQAENWLGSTADDLVWCTASSGWSKSARNVFVAPWLTGATTLVHDARFDPGQRLDLIEREQVTILCMAPTEYRTIARNVRLRRLPSLRGMVAAGEALNPEILDQFRSATGLTIRDGFGQTETGQLTGTPAGGQARPGSMGRSLPGIAMSIDDGELVVDPSTVPTFFMRYHGEEPPSGVWRTGDRASVDEDGYFYFEGRSDDVIISSGYRIGPFEVESALLGHPSVAESAAVATPDAQRGSVVRAVVVLRAGYEPSDALVAELQAHVKSQTAPYKYPRVIEFADALPKTASGKIRRALVRATAYGPVPDGTAGERQHELTQGRHGLRDR